MIDYHIHTQLCRHAKGRMRDYTEAAIAGGINEICFTGHIPLPAFPRKGARLRMDERELEAYFRELEEVRKNYRQVRILTGIEADYYEGYEEYTAVLLRRYPFDLVLMSVHFIHSWPPGFWVYRHDFEDKSIQGIYGDYCSELKNGIKTGLYDSVAHLDLIKESGKPLLDTNRDDVEQILDLCVEHGMSIEINTSGARKPIGEIFPSPDILRLAASRGIPFTLGSDAHEPSQVGYRFPQVFADLTYLPDSRIARYSERNRTVHFPSEIADLRRPDDPAIDS